MNLFCLRDDRSELPAFRTANRTSLGDTHDISFTRLFFRIVHHIAVCTADVLAILLVLKPALDSNDDRLRALVAYDDSFAKLSTASRVLLLLFCLCHTHSPKLSIRP